MKRYLLTLLVLGSLSPLAAMRRPTPPPKKTLAKGAAKKSAPPKAAAVPKRIENKKGDAKKPSIIENYIDMGDLIISIGRLYKREKVDTGSLCIAFLEALSLEKLPITLEDGRETVLGEFFKQDELKECISQFLTRWFAGTLKKRHMADALESLQKSLKMGAIKDEFGDQEWIDLDKTFEKLIAYYGGEETGELEEAIDLEKLPALFGFAVKEYFLIDRLNEALNDALKGEALTKSVLLDCVDIEQIALRRGYDEVPHADGIRESIELFLATMEDDKKAMFRIFEILGENRLREKGEAEDKPQPAGAGKDAARIKQEKDDEALAKRLASEWNGN